MILVTGPGDRSLHRSRRLLIHCAASDYREQIYHTSIIIIQHKKQYTMYPSTVYIIRIPLKTLPMVNSSGRITERTLIHRHLHYNMFRW